jgi:putative NIF3 family GTP cyclohydrolase 1 type 2
VGDPKQPVEKVAVVTGSGAEYFREAKQAGADVLVTGDVKYHTALDALSEGIAVVDVGHFTGEIGMVSLVAERLRRWARGKKISLPVHETEAQEDPFHFFHGT